jgi:hypothetical protein
MLTFFITYAMIHVQHVKALHPLIVFNVQLDLQYLGTTVFALIHWSSLMLGFVQPSSHLSSTIKISITGH